MPTEGQYWGHGVSAISRFMEHELFQKYRIRDLPLIPGTV